MVKILPYSRQGLPAGRKYCYGIACMVALSLAGCAVTPEPFTQQENSQRASDLLERYTADQEPVTAPIDLYTAMARAIKYNLDYRIELMETAARLQQLDVSRYDMLPRIVGSLNYNGRSNDAGSVSQSLLTGKTSLEPSTSSERESLAGDLTLSWDVLDFGLSYVRAKQKADEVLQAEENKRRVVQRIVEDVRSAYWRAASAERLMARTQQLEERTQQALDMAQRQKANHLTSPMAALSYQRELLSIRQQLQQLTRELKVSKQQLAALMNLPPDTEYSIVVPARDLAWESLNMSYDDMLHLAVMNRPELHEVAYKLRSNDLEGTAVLLQTLPSLRLFAGANWSNDDFLYNSDWASWGAKASWNLLNVFRIPAEQERIEAGGELLDARAKALTMAVATQVSVSRARYALRRKELDTAQRYLAVQSSIEHQIEAGYRAESVSRQTWIREQMNTVVAEAKLDVALADLQSAYANVYTSMGIDAVDASMSTDEGVAQLAGDLRRLWAGRGDALALSGDL